MKPRHAWDECASQWNGQDVQRCRHCMTERTRDTATASLWLFRRGKATRTNNGPMKPLTDDWRAFKAGVTPECIIREGGVKP